MKKDEHIDEASKLEEPQAPFIKTFSSQEEAEKFNLTKDIHKPDYEKFQMFCRMMRIGKMLSEAKVVK
ncbi:MAG: hypothetical protein HYR66_14740 [Sphingobacteriales bacterium]|nr:hypothetical protein [Sphingobacteriales bacterium]MBI3720642.1 hypothetical protein [Sphingobacteriales bacterium]